MNYNRTKKFSRNQELMEALSKINNSIEGITINKNRTKLKFRPIFIMGCARSGSTLLMHWLANSGLFTYPTNIIARFYSNPAFGANVQKILLDYDDKGQIFNKSYLLKSKDYNSNLGHSIGPLAPSEFWYFWRFYFNKIHFDSKFDLKEIDKDGFLNSLYSFEAVYDKPLLMKAMILNWNISLLKQLIPSAIFLFIERNPFYVAQSLLESRIKFFNNIEEWWSFKPKEYDILVKKDPYEQVVGQVYYTNKSIKKSLDQLPERDKILIQYESFCNDPEILYKKIMALVFPNRTQKYNGKNSFNIRNEVRLKELELNKLKEHVENYYGK